MDEKEEAARQKRVGAAKQKLAEAVSAAKTELDKAKEEGESVDVRVAGAPTMALNRLNTAIRAAEALGIAVDDAKEIFSRLKGILDNAKMGPAKATLQAARNAAETELDKAKEAGGNIDAKVASAPTVALNKLNSAINDAKKLNIEVAYEEEIFSKLKKLLDEQKTKNEFASRFPERKDDASSYQAYVRQKEILQQEEDALNAQKANLTNEEWLFRYGNQRNAENAIRIKLGKKDFENAVQRWSDYKNRDVFKDELAIKLYDLLSAQKARIENELARVQSLLPKRDGSGDDKAEEADVGDEDADGEEADGGGEEADGGEEDEAAESSKKKKTVKNRRQKSLEEQLKIAEYDYENVRPEVMEELKSYGEDVKAVAKKRRKARDKRYAEKKRARLSARTDRRKAKVTAKRESLAKDSEETAQRTALAALVLDEEQAALQARFNAEDGVPATIVNGSKEDELAPARVPRGLGRDPWPICGMEFSQAQLENLFLTAEEVWGKTSDDAGGGMDVTMAEVTVVIDGNDEDDEDDEDDGDDEDGEDGEGGEDGEDDENDEDDEDGTAEAVPMPLGASPVVFGASASVVLTESALNQTDPLIFNTFYARRLLAAHLSSLKKIWEYAVRENKSATYVAVWSAVGEEIGYDGAAVKQLLPQFEQLLRYRNTILKVKELQIAQEIEMKQALEDGSGVSGLQRELRVIQKMKIRTQWNTEARRVLAAARGQLPGQLATPQPYFLPLRIAAPPRVGKSAAALLMASLAKRLGMTTMYSVAPYKDTPIQELSTKLIRIGWDKTVDDAAKKASARLEAANSTSTSTSASSVRRADCVQMEYRFHTIDDMPGKPSAPDYRKIDMVAYSSDIPTDCQRAGAVLADWRYRACVVFHIRDEAQSLAHELVNKEVEGQLRDVPPPVELQYLRYYYGNVYGLNCNVTATHFPTLLEEDMWGYIGSVRQNAQAGLPISASWRQISSQVASQFLPKLVPALLPTVSPGYIGVDYLTVWQRNGVDVEMQAGVKSAVDKKLDRIIAEVPVAPSASSSAPAPEPVTEPAKVTRASTPATRRSARLLQGKQDNQAKGGLTREERDELVQQAEEAADKEIADVVQMAFQDDADKNDDEFIDDGDRDGDDGDNDGVSQAKKGKKKGKGSGPTKEELKRLKRQEEEKKKRLIEEDIRSIQDHFFEWLMKSEEADINRWRPERSSEPPSGTNLVPMYVGALNTEINDAGMVSFIRVFGELAQNELKGVAFILFSSELTQAEQLKRVRVSLVPKDNPEVIKLSQPSEAASTAVKPSPCEPAARATKTSALCCVYDPKLTENKGKGKGKAKSDGPYFKAYAVPSAEVAIKEVWNVHKINKIAILGYGKLKAGLTLQTVMTGPYPTPSGPETTRIYVPQYISLATGQLAALDAQLQIAGRSFVELKGETAPDKKEWQIRLLGVAGIVERLKRYSAMEKILAEIEGARVYEALKKGFPATLLVDKFQTGRGEGYVVGTQRGDFNGILGLTPTAAKARAKAAANLVRRLETAGQPDEVQIDEDEQIALAEALEVEVASPTASSEAATDVLESPSLTDPSDLESSNVMEVD